MKITKLTPNIPVAHQLAEQDLAEAAAAAERLSLAYWHIPVVPGEISDNQVEAFRATLSGAEKPALAFCRTGTRSAT